MSKVELNCKRSVKDQPTRVVESTKTVVAKPDLLAILREHGLECSDHKDLVFGCHVEANNVVFRTSLVIEKDPDVLKEAARREEIEAAKAKAKENAEHLSKLKADAEAAEAKAKEEAEKEKAELEAKAKELAEKVAAEKEAAAKAEAEKAEAAAKAEADKKASKENANKKNSKK